MKPIPSDILTQYEAVLKKRAVPVSRYRDYRKWLLYYLDFREKYPLVVSLPAYSEKRFWRSQGYPPKYIPVVLSRREIDAVLKHLEYPYNLAVKLLYGCGLRLFECVQLRVKNFNFDAGILTVHGKGGKDRTVPIPQTIMPELTAQVEAIKNFTMRILRQAMRVYFLKINSKKNIQKPVRSLSGNGFFPQQSLTCMPDTKELRRYHLHETHVQLALYQAVRRAKLTKRTPPTPYATLLPRTCFRRIMTSVPFRRCWDIPTSGPQ